VASTALARDTLAVVLAAYESERAGRRVELTWSQSEPAPGDKG
jgi:hypothetical protein